MKAPSAMDLFTRATSGAGNNDSHEGAGEEDRESRGEVLGPPASRTHSDPLLKQCETMITKGSLRGVVRTVQMLRQSGKNLTLNLSMDADSANGGSGESRLGGRSSPLPGSPNVSARGVGSPAASPHVSVSRDKRTRHLQAEETEGGRGDPPGNGETPSRGNADHIILGSVRQNSPVGPPSQGSSTPLGGSLTGATLEVVREIESIFQGNGSGVVGSSDWRGEAPRSGRKGSGSMD
eukprot:CAMPEP_0172048738 /NCGR_PEP_ID=MMETSP1043-20130122/1692_1 /TAXON_ID=464988 /ORGANISM="Hemiselmis andersenii, Strain CCMP441" /LENGTH=235 /DNA_ID=CAMNT_0012707659 /DNA_START=108 /DNA_END=812 /DNA_ORIENTATION=+